MPYSITTKDGITINNIPDSIPPDSDELKRRVTAIRAQETPAGGPVSAVLEPLAAIVSGAIAEPVAGLAGIAQAINPLAAPGAGAQAVEETREALSFQPRTQAGQAGLQAVGGAIEPLAQAGRFVESGLGGIAELAAGQGLPRAVQTVEDIQRQGVTGERAFEVTGSPLVGASVAAAPTAVGEAVGLQIPAQAARVASGISARLGRRGGDILEEVEKIKAVTPEQALEQAADAIKSGSPEDIGRIVQPDKAFFEAADELNITVEPLASFGSQNPQFVALEQGLASIPASQLDAQSKAFVLALGQKADDLITEYGGTLDKADLSDRFRAESLGTIDMLSDQADKLYDTLGTKIRPSTRVEATNTVDFILQKADDLGGVNKLPSFLKKIITRLRTKETGQIRRSNVTGEILPRNKVLPTYANLDQIRKEVGQATNKGTGPFKDGETGLMKAIYKRLRQDQDAVAVARGAGDVSEAANAVIRQRKHLEDNLAKLLGKDLEGSILPTVGRALKGLAKGDVQKWDSVMNRIDNASIRQEIVVSSLNDIFSGSGLGGKSLSPVQFTKFMDDLSRQPAIKKRLYKELPKESITALENLRTVSRGVAIASGDRINTGRLAALFDSEDGLMRRMMGKALMTAVAVKAGPLAASAASEFINQSTNGAKAASAVLASAQFQNIVKQAVRDGVTEGAQVTEKLRKAEAAFQKSKTYDRWANTLATDDRLKLLSVGTLNYLLQEEE